MAVKFVIDSASDVLLQECQAWGVTLLPLTIRFGAEEYADGITLSHADFYRKLASDSNHPTSSQVTPAVFADAFETLTEDGDQVVCITLSSRLSGTYQSACIAAEDFEGKVFVLDSYTATAGERVLLLRGMELAKEGRSAQEIVEILEQEKSKVRIFAYIDTLEYLKRGGRISAATAVVGGLLNIKPLIAVNDGVVVNVGKARGAKLGNQMLRDFIQKTNGIDETKPFTLMYCGLSEEPTRKFAEDSAALWPNTPEVPIATVGCVIGTHIGPGAVAIAYFEK